MTRPNPDQEALLATIWAAPHDDLPRLVYADWLDEHGQPERAEFIRPRIDRAAREAAGDDVTVETWRREEELCVAHGEEWLDADGGSGVDAPFMDDFRGGFGWMTRTVSSERLERERPPAGQPWFAKVEIRWSAPDGLVAIDIAAAVRGVREVESWPHDTPWTAADFAAVASADDGDGQADVINGTMAGGARVNALTPAGEALARYFAFGDAGAAVTTGVRVGRADPDWPTA